jgi:hypothetical protein
MVPLPGKPLELVYSMQQQLQSPTCEAHRQRRATSHVQELAIPAAALTTAQLNQVLLLLFMTPSAISLLLQVLLQLTLLAQLLAQLLACQLLVCRPLAPLDSLLLTLLPAAWLHQVGRPASSC